LANVSDSVEALIESLKWLLAHDYGLVVTDRRAKHTFNFLYKHPKTYETTRPKSNTSSTAQGGGGSFKNRKPIGEIGCCESGMAERSH